jgi:hypothetical protein
VYLLSVADPTTVPPQHSASVTFRTLLLEHRPALARVIEVNGRPALQLTTNEAWAVVKNRFRVAGSTIKVKQDKLNPSGYFIPPFAAPYPPNPQETNGRRLQRELWENATKF